ncbi:MAG: prepilin-type N-terminal cleavage/methylation domain-containing protein [Phycisphaerae bacterium]
MQNAPANPKRRSPRAFTLVEVLVCAVLMVLGFVALVAAFGHETVVTQRGEDITLATFLADEIRDRALGMNFAAVLALDGVSYDPAILSTGASQNLDHWVQKIDVTPVSASDLNEEVPADGARAACLTVEILAKGNPVLAQTYYILDVSGVPEAE